APGELAIRAARSLDMPFSLSFSYCFSFLTLGLRSGMAPPFISRAPGRSHSTSSTGGGRSNAPERRPAVGFQVDLDPSSRGVCGIGLPGTQAERALCRSDRLLPRRPRERKGEEMQQILVAIAVWFGLELLLMAVLF